MERGAIQQELFQKKPIDQDYESFKELLKMFFKACEKVYSSRVIREAFAEFEIEKDIEREMEEEFEREAEGEDDF